MCPRASRGSAGSRPTPSCALPTGPVPSAVPSTTLALASAPALRATMSPSHRKTRGAPTNSLRSTAPSAAATVYAAAPRPSLFAVARVSSLSFLPHPTHPHPHLLLLFSHNPFCRTCQQNVRGSPRRVPDARSPPGVQHDHRAQYQHTAPACERPLCRNTRCQPEARPARHGHPRPLGRCHRRGCCSRPSCRPLRLALAQD